ncbi:hypothetical protein EHV15_34290 [Paenibacillus oralis]|uniref:Uncharacterized protein n=1 Tax=Paenibacillus oralis TaxID=2490856 RepID=A0A3P3TAW9_9BACL|nr:hypothetical protein EHV15_34290 [Paenibacillus oralis]
MHSMRRFLLPTTATKIFVCGSCRTPRNLLKG